MKRIAIVMVTVLLAGCLQEPEQECLGSNECPNSSMCRAGMCVEVANTPGDAATSISQDTTAEATHRDVRSTESTTDAVDSDRPDAPVSDAGDIDESPCPGATAPALGQLRINELMANPPADELGDSNRDGTRDAFEDEFVEVVNVTDRQLDLTQTRLFVGGTAKILFADICLPPAEGIVVFGGYRGQGDPIVARGSTSVVSPSRLGLSNSGGSVSLALTDGTSLDSVSYSDAPRESLTRAPQLDGPDFVEHSTLPGDRLMSPGQCADGQILTTKCPNSEPTPDAGGDSD